MLVPNLRHFCDIDAELGPIREMGAGRAGRRRIIPIVGGSVSGPDISGRLLNLGADWQTIFADGLAELDACHRHGDGLQADNRRLTKPAGAEG